MRFRLNLLLVSCILLTIATAMLFASCGIKALITTPNDLRVQSAGYGALAMLLVVLLISWTGLIKSERKAWVVVLAIALLWEYPIFARLYVEHYGLALPLAIIHELAFIGTDSWYIQLLLGIFGCLLTLAALVLSVIPVFWGKGKQIEVGRRFVLASTLVIVVLLAAGTWERLHETAIPSQELTMFTISPPPPPAPPEASAKLPICDTSICSCAK